MRNHKLPVLLVCLVLCVCFRVPAFAAETNEPAGSITVTLTDGAAGTSRAGVVFEYARVADVIDGEYVLTDGYSGVDLNAVATAEEMKKAADKLAETAEPDGRVTTDGAGTAVIGDLSPGVYLIRAVQRPNYDIVSPALATIPTWDETNGEMLYNIEIKPKHTPVPPDPRAPQTGDARPVVLMLAVFALSIFLILALLSFRTRRGGRNRDE